MRERSEATGPLRARVLRSHLPALAGYALLASLLTWPLLAHFATQVPGDGGDDPALVWSLWWVRFALLRGANPFTSAWMFSPIGINLAFYTLTVLNACLSAPLQDAIGLVPASNLILLSSYVVGGYGAYLLALQELGHHRTRSAAWLAGVVYAFAAPKLFYAALGQFNIASSQWLPFAALYMLRLARRTRWQDAALAALFTALQAWAEMTYASFLLVFFGLLLAWRLACLLRQHRPGPARALLRLGLAAGLLLALFLLLIAPMLANMLPDMLVEGDFSVVEGGFADIFSADLAGFLAPTILHPLLGGVVRHWLSFTNLDKGQHLWFGYLTLALAMVGAAPGGGRRRGFWAFAAVVFLLLSLGPAPRLNGRVVDLPMPFEAVQALPFFKANRYPSRYGVMLALALSVLAAGGLRRLQLRFPTAARVLAAVAVLVIVFENLSLPLPLSDMRIPAVYARLREQPGDFAVLELPLAWRNGFRITGTPHVAIMFSQYYQTEHEKRLLGGNTSRNPELKFQYFTEMPVLESLVALEAGRELSEATLAADRAMGGAVLSFLGIRYIVSHSPPASDPLLRYVETILPTRLLFEENGLRLYAVEPKDLGGVLDPRLALAEGWGERRSPAVAVRPRARLLLPSAAGGRDVVLRLRGFGEAEMIAVRDSGTVLARCMLGREASECRFRLPRFEAPVQEVWLESRSAHDPRALPAERGIGGTGVESPLDIYVRSAGEEFGDFGHVYLAGREASPNRRGYNLVAVSPESGAILSARNFDVHADPGASLALAHYLESLPAGTIVAGAVADEGSRLLGDEAVAALRGLGLSTDLRDCFRCAHAFVGVKGAPAGTAPEAWGALGVREVRVGRGLTEPRVYYELESVELSPGS